MRTQVARAELHEVASLEESRAIHMRQINAMVAATLRSDAAHSRWVADLVNPPHCGLRIRTSSLQPGARLCSKSASALPKKR